MGAAPPPTIPVFQPYLDDAETTASREALELGWLGLGAYVGEFEAALERLCDGERRAVAVSTGHAALHLALILAGAGPGDEVITPSFNNVADLQAILATGAVPVFCDIEEPTLCIDLDAAEELVSGRTRAVIVMDYACMLADHGRAATFARDHGVRIIHDAAHSFGSRQDGRAIGSFSDLAMFSFDPVKTITCIDGGALMVQSEEEVARLQEMRLLGMGQSASVMYRNARAWNYDVRALGFRYHLANLHAAVGLAQLGKFAAIERTRRAACRYYASELAAVEGLTLPETDFEDVTPFLFYVRLEPHRREAFGEHLLRRGVETGIHWQPGHTFTLFEGCRRGELTVTERVGGEILTLPLHSGMQRETQDRVIDAVRTFFDDV